MWLREVGWVGVVLIAGLGERETTRLSSGCTVVVKMKRLVGLVFLLIVRTRTRIVSLLLRVGVTQIWRISIVVVAMLSFVCL